MGIMPQSVPPTTEVDLVVEGTLRPYAAVRANRDKKLIYEREVA